MIEFKRNKETGIVEVWKDGKKVDEIIDMGDEIKKEDEDDDRSKHKG